MFSFEKFQEEDYNIFDKFCEWFSKQDFRQRHLILNQLTDLHLSLENEKRQEMNENEAQS